MASLTIRHVPDEVLEKLRARARADRRTLDSEVIHLLGVALATGDGGTASDQAEAGRAQVEAWRRLAGRWQSDVDSHEEIESLYAARTRGRIVEL